MAEEFDLDLTLLQAEEKMELALSHLKRELGALRTGRATPTLLDGIRVKCYDGEYPLNQVANITVPEARLIAINPWDKTVIGAIEKAIISSDIGITPANDGSLIRLNVPLLTEQRRKDIVKTAHKLGEEGKVSVRNARRDANELIKAAEKRGDVPEDESRKSLDKIQEMTDKFIKDIDKLIADKEKEIMEG